MFATEWLAVQILFATYMLIRCYPHTCEFAKCHSYKTGLTHSESPNTRLVAYVVRSIIYTHSMSTYISHGPYVRVVPPSSPSNSSSGSPDELSWESGAGESVSLALLHLLLLFLLSPLNTTIPRPATNRTMGLKDKRNSRKSLSVTVPGRNWTLFCYNYILIALLHLKRHSTELPIRVGLMCTL